MKVLVACEFSGTVREAFRARGHDAWSCDLLPTEAEGPHVEGDVLELLGRGWDLMVAHPPCTYLASSGLHWNGRIPGRAEKTEEAIAFVRALADAPIERVAIENPIGRLSTAWRRPDQIVQPHQFGHPESKATCFWLKGLPLLKPTKILEPERVVTPDGEIYRDGGGSTYSPTHYFTGRGQRDSAQLGMFPDARIEQRARWANQTASGQNKLPPSADRWKIRSLTYQGIADAMADQWGAR